MYCLFPLQSLCWSSFAWYSLYVRYSLYVDWLQCMLWELWNWMLWLHLHERFWGRSRATIIIHNGFVFSGTLCCTWDILQCISGYNDRTTDMAASLSHTCEKDANKGAHALLYCLLHIWYSAVNLQLVFHCSCWVNLNTFLICTTSLFSDFLSLLRNVYRNCCKM